MSSLRCAAALATGLIYGLTCGCGFFEELKSADSSESSGGGSGSDESVGSGPCEPALDDLCPDQDTLRACSVDSGEIDLYDCRAVCGDFLNFTCLSTATGQHACWCTLAGKQKVLSCTELESCMLDCQWDATTACADTCFSRTDETTIRLYGALVHCAHHSCRPTCIDTPEDCAFCIDSGIADGTSGCSLERSVCDTDRNDEPYP